MSTVPKGLELYAVFNEQGNWIAWSFGSIPSSPNLKTKLVDPGDTAINLTTCKWEGDMETGRIVDNKKQLPQIDEATLIRQKYDHVYKTYNIPTVLWAILQQFDALIRRNKIGQELLDEDFKKILDLFRESEERYVRTLAHFQNSANHSFVSEQEAREQFLTTFQSK